MVRLRISGVVWRPGNMGEDMSESTAESTAVSFVLRVVEGPDSGRSHPVTSGEYVIGRARDCTFVLADPAASRKHFRLMCRGEALEVMDMGTSYGTFVNGVRISRGRVCVGDRLQIGDSVFVIDPSEVDAKDG